MPRSRVFGVMQYAVNPETGEKLLTEDKIRHVLGTYKSIKRWAWIAHDHDLYDSEEDKAKHPEDATKPNADEATGEAGELTVVGLATSPLTPPPRGPFRSRLPALLTARSTRRRSPPTLGRAPLRRTAMWCLAPGTPAMCWATARSAMRTWA